MRITSGVVVAGLSWALSSWSVLFSVQYGLGAILGTRGETPDFVFVLLWAVVIASISLSVWAMTLLKRKIIPIFPIAAGLIVYVMIYFVYPYLACLKYGCIVVPG